ncbi:DUF1857-domain-containing protein [Coprinopsis marcescibilis]|uniref:DUF1857-domain-containing protein n=1 Tax=Coprinopsis marcescibilis TaxID=230819 RepID=A0A5C3KP97_COPMA|nr:DUF1857-domain-containing protein [Coprinopsis marcescibilis]
MSQPIINFASSRRVNPPGVSPVLTAEQVWKGLQIKARDPISFVAAISSCKIVEDNGDEFVREVVFGNNPPVQEKIRMYKGAIAFFDMKDPNIHITNTLSVDENDDLILTFAFAGGVPGYHSKEPPTLQNLNKSVGNGPAITITRIRELVQEGTIV